MSKPVEQSLVDISEELKTAQERLDRICARVNRYIQSNGSSPELKRRSQQKLEQFLPTKQKVTNDSETGKENK